MRIQFSKHFSVLFFSQEQYCTNKERMREGHEKSFSTFFFYSASWEKANFLSLEGEWLFAVARRQDHLTLFEEFWIKLHFSLSFTTLFSPRLRRRRRGFFLKCRLSSGDTKSRVAFPSHEFRGTVVNKEILPKPFSLCTQGVPSSTTEFHLDPNTTKKTMQQWHLHREKCSRSRDVRLMGWITIHAKTKQQILTKTSHTKNPNFTQIEKMADKASVRWQIV